jgi:c(7)-type cytochrome triheme protein
LKALLVVFLAWGWGQRYSHPDHAAMVQKRGQGAVDCRTCHQLAAGSFQPLVVGRDDHKPCIDCHGGADFARGPRCLTCHSSISKMKPGRTWPFSKPGQFHVVFDHPKHVALTTNRGECGGCHGGAGGKADMGHVACARCHSAGTLPDMNFCGGCHKAGAGEEREAEEASAFRVPFSHARHKDVSRAPCISCHVGLATAQKIERPPMKQCESCHDGKQAFDARGTHCGRCHKSPQSLSGVRTELPPFSHAAHATRGVSIQGCTACHGVGESWRATMPGQKEHRPCQNDACHAADFGKIGARLCLSCHERNDPFEPNPIKRPTSRVKPEWTVKMSHAPHLPLKNVNCNMCHPSILDPIATINDGHALCGYCHKAKAKPGMDGCAACHQALATKSVAPWSVGGRFRHDTNHRSGCESCHRTASSSDLTPPRMEECGSCHDGKNAFKVTGFGCVKCHGARK